MRILKQFVTSEEYFHLESLWRGEAGVNSWEVSTTAERSRHYRFIPSLHHDNQLHERCLRHLPRVTGDGLHHTDAFFLHYLPGDHVSAHLDARSGWRLNVMLKPAEKGGEFIVGGRTVTWSPCDAVIFRPDHEPHEVKKIIEGQRLIWSIGRCRSPAVTERPYPKIPPDV